MKPILVVIFTWSLFATAHAEKKGLELVKAVVNRYQAASAVEIELKKKVTLALLEETNESAGTLWLSKGKMRLETKKPNESLIVMGADIIWVVTPTPEELGGKPQVLKIRSKEISRQSKAPIAALLGKASAWDQFKITSESQEDSVTKFVLEPRQAGAMGDIVKLQIDIDVKDKRLKRFAYTDELENQTAYDFSSTDFSAKVSSKKFTYSPPKNADITEY